MSRLRFSTLGLNRLGCFVTGDSMSYSKLLVLDLERVRVLKIKISVDESSRLDWLLLSSRLFSQSLYLLFLFQNINF